MNVLGISGLHHSVQYKRREFPHLPPRCYRIAQGFDSAAALVTADGIEAAAAEERFTGEKATGTFPLRAIQYCLSAAHLKPSDVSYVAHSFAYERYRSFYEQSDLLRQQYAEVYSTEAQRHCLSDFLPESGLAEKFIPVEHHLAHAASTFYVSGFKDALILINDGMGEQNSTTVALGSPSGIQVVKQISAPHSLGLLYGIFTLYLGYHFGMDEYKVMGLAPYGNPQRFFRTIMAQIFLQEDGTYAIPMLCQNSTLEEKETYGGTMRLLAEMFGPPRQPEEPLTRDHMDIAAGVQAVLQTCLLHTLRYFKKETGHRNLCLAGGVALNCTANSVIHRSRLFQDIFVQPAAGDDGSALGAALYVQREKEPDEHLTRMRLPLWGPDFAANSVHDLLQHDRRCESNSFDRFDDLAAAVTRRIASGQVCAWFQGRMEFGPRALGNRSILADPQAPGMRDRINAVIKQREEYRPFAPAVTVEAASRYFEIGPDNLHLYETMLFVAQVRAGYQHKLPAITHVDGSARVQIVTQNANERFWRLLTEYGNLTGIPILLNTSFNLRGQPIVCTPDDALNTFLASEIDFLVIGDHLVQRCMTH